MCLGFSKSNFPCPVVRGVRRADYSARSRCVTLKHQRQPVYSRKYRSNDCQSYSQSSYNNSLSSAQYVGSESYLPPLIPDPLAPPTSIDSPPRYYSATLPPPRTKTHAASTQTLLSSKRRMTEARVRRRPHHPPLHLSHSSSPRTSAKSTPKHHVSTSTSPQTLDPSSLSCGRAQPSLTTCTLPPCQANSCDGKKMSVIDILDDLKTKENNKTTAGSGEVAGVGVGVGRISAVSGLAVACPRAPSLSSQRAAQAAVKENHIAVVRKESNHSVADMATSPAERQDLINKIGKRIRFRKKKKEKIKTENRAKKALKTISLILGAFVTCWTPYHILAIIASFCPTCVNIHIYMLSYFLCYANR